MIGSIPTITSDNDMSKGGAVESSSYSIPEDPTHSQFSGFMLSSSVGQPGQTPTHDPLVCTGSLSHRKLDTLLSNYITEEHTDTYAISEYTKDNQEEQKKLIS